MKVDVFIAPANGMPTRCLPIVVRAHKIVNNMSRIVDLKKRPPHGLLVDSVKRRIERMILTGEIAAGERLNEMRLAEQLDISRGPVREALRALEHAGLVTALPNRGVFVRRIGLEEALQLYDVRAALARMAGRLLAVRITRSQITALEQTYKRMEGACRAADTAAFYEGNLAFHSQLLEFCGNPRLAAMNEAVRNELQLYLRRAVLGPTQLQVSNAEHRRILDAVTGGDAEGAGQAFEAHIMAGKQRVLDNLGSRGDNHERGYLVG